MVQRIRWFLVLSGIIVLLVFSLANTGSVPVSMPFVFSTELPLALLLLVTSAIGFLLGSVVTAWMLRRSRKAAPKNLDSDSGGSQMEEQSASKPSEPKPSEPLAAVAGSEN